MARLGTSTSRPPGSFLEPALRLVTSQPGKDSFLVRGDPSLVQRCRVALLASVSAPVDLILPSFDLARAARELGVPLVGAFQSPLEKMLLDVLLKGHAPVVVCPARRLEDMRLPSGWLDAVAQRRMAIVAASTNRLHRPTARSAETRNRMILGLADALLVIHARPAGRLARLALTALELGKSVLCFEHPANRDLVLNGARQGGVEELASWALEAGRARVGASWDDRLDGPP